MPFLLLSLNCFAQLAPITHPILFPCVNKNKTFYIRSSSHHGNGTIKNPFAAINQGLQAAARENLCIARLILQSGTYRGFSKIDRPTTLIGKRLAGAAIPVISGTISNNRKFLTLEGIVLRGASGSALKVMGGRINLKRILISDVTKNNNTYPSGIALQVGDGAQAILENVTFKNNQVGAILARGPKTVVKGIDLNFISNRINSTWLPEEFNSDFSGLAVVEVRNKAKLLLDGFYFHGNQAISIYLHNKAQANIRRGRITETYMVENSLGYNIFVRSYSRLQMQTTISENSVIGLVVTDGYIFGRYSKIQKNAIGIHYVESTPLGYHWTRCIPKDVSFIDNEIRVSGMLPPFDSMRVCYGDNPPAACFDSCKRVAVSL